VENLELSIDVVLHGSGAASTWAETVQRGDRVAVSGPGRGYDIDPEATSFLLAGDETAIPAICQLLEHLPNVPITVHVSLSDEEARVDVHREVDVTWHTASDVHDSEESLYNSIREADLESHLNIWAAGEAAAMQRIRRYLFSEVDFPRSQTNVRGYWKRAGG
jgi:NADPH-dependent ferric siderophore reductase